MPIRTQWPLHLLFAFVALGSYLPAADPLRVMSFNIRYGTANDGDNHWDLRREHVITTIADFAPDLLGTQETLQFQADFIAQQLPQYSYFGRSRMKTPNEHCGIFYKTDRFTWLAGGHFWLSETPEIPESISWDSSLPRMASWVLLSDNQDENAPAILFVNTHFDHRGSQARQQSASTIRERIDSLSNIAREPIAILTGDFNVGAQSEPYRALLDDNDRLRDTYRETHPQPSAGEGTFGGFVGRTDGDRIDWIVASPKLAVLSAEIDRREFGGRNPSDHFPVTAVLKLND